METETAGNITLCDGSYGWDYIIEHDDGRDIMIQTDWDYPGLARTFGWEGDDSDIGGAQAYLDDNIGATVEDPGYFQ